MILVTYKIDAHPEVSRRRGSATTGAPHLLVVIEIAGVGGRGGRAAEGRRQRSVLSAAADKAITVTIRRRLRRRRRRRARWPSRPRRLTTASARRPAVDVAEPDADQPPHPAGRGAGASWSAWTVCPHGEQPSRSWRRSDHDPRTEYQSHPDCYCHTMRSIMALPHFGRSAGTAVPRLRLSEIRRPLVPPSLRLCNPTSWSCRLGHRWSPTIVW